MATLRETTLLFFKTSKMEELKFCPKCGDISLHFDKINRLHCSSCDFVLYHNCAGTVAVMLRYQDEVFLTIRNQEPQKGKLDLPGGFCDPNESAEQTCQRELYEELKLQINPEKLSFLATQPNVYRYKNIDYNTLDIFFEYQMDMKFQPQIEESEIADGVWFRINEIPIDNLAFNSQRIFFERKIIKL